MLLPNHARSAAMNVYRMPAAPLTLVSRLPLFMCADLPLVHFPLPVLRERVG